MNGIVRWEESLQNNAVKRMETKGQLKAKIMKNKQLTHDRARRWPAR